MDKIRALVALRYQWACPGWLPYERLEACERVYAGELGEWPQAYLHPDGSYRLRAKYHPPDAVYAFVGVLIVIGAGLLGLARLWQASAPGAAGAVILGLVFLALLPVLWDVPAEKLELVIYPDGRILVMSVWMKFAKCRDKDAPLVLHVQGHSNASASARLNEARLHERRQAWAVKAHEARQANKPPPPEPGPPMDLYADASELIVCSGPSGAQWIPLAEFGDDRQGRSALMLKAAIEFIVARLPVENAARAGATAGRDEYE